MLHKYLTIATVAIAVTNLYGYDQKISITETKLVQKQAGQPKATPESNTKSVFKNYKPFTGQVLGNGVRLRLQPDVESSILKELVKNDFLVVLGEKNGFYAVEAPTSMNVYIFRSFVLDNFVEGNRVNVRLQPSLTSPVVGYMSTGEKIEGKISEENHKWLEFSPPKSVHFFIAKEYLEKVGGPEMKALHDKKMANLNKLVESANLLAQSEMLKPYKEIDFVKITEGYSNIIDDYESFPLRTAEARAQLTTLQEDYLKKKITYLENKANIMSRNIASGAALPLVEKGQTALTSKDRMKIWERAEEAIFFAWSSHHNNKTMTDFYEQEKFKCTKISGIVEVYSDSVMNKPGSYIIRDRDLPQAYVYSTSVDLHKHIGQYVTLQVSERDNNNFAFPAFFVMGIE